ncbi:MAG: AIPR family protein [Fibrobacter sp.]|nr:AIPR family protein [Fibrobacter sp.]
MDRITKSYLDDFSNLFSLNSKMDESVKFEHFVNYTLIEPKTSSAINLEELNIGANGTIGLDGFAVLLNNEIISTEEELDDFMKSAKRVYGEVIFIQAKTSMSFDSKEVSNFGLSVNDFISEDPKYSWNDNAKRKIKFFNKFVSYISKFEEKPTCNLYYVCLGIDGKDQNVYAKKEEIIPQIMSQNVFSEINFDLIDNIGIQNRYKSIGRKLKKTFEFSQKITLPVIENVKESYLGLIDGKTVLSLMSDDNGNAIPNVFYDNVRDYQGENRVNSEIQTTLNSDYKDSFSILNNGMTIVAEELTTTRNEFSITNYQIINGCQTANVLFHNKSLVDEKIQVSLKLIITQNQDVISRVIRSTNSQTEIKTQDLLAYSKFQKRLEDFYSTYPDLDRLYYERRSKQYNSTPIEKNRIIDKTLQIKVVGSLFFDKPNLATRYFGTLFNEFKGSIFKDSDNMSPYYTAAYVYYKIDELFRNGSLDSVYKKFKFLIMTMFRYEINKQAYPKFNSKDIDKYCNDLIAIVNNSNKLKGYMNSITRKLDAAGDDLKNTELTKSVDFVNKAMQGYPGWHKKANSI